MTIFSSEPVIILTVALVAIIGGIALLMAAMERRKPILQAFFLATACSAGSVACLFESAWTDYKPWDIGTTLFGLAMLYFIGCLVLRWWRKYGPA